MKLIKHCPTCGEITNIPLPNHTPARKAFAIAQKLACATCDEWRSRLKTLPRKKALILELKP
jgi:hypothetical protein